MARSGSAAALLAVAIALASCGGPPTDDGLRIIVSSGPVYEVPTRDAPPAKPVPQTAGRGTLILEGGGDYLDEASEMTVALAGTKPVVCLIDPGSKGGGDAYHKFDGIGGFKMLTVNLTATSSQQARVLEALESCTGYFINTGDPIVLSSALRPNAADSSALKIIRRRFEQNGAVIAGTGTGTMIVGDLTLCDCGGESSVEALTQGTIFEAPGYVFVHGVLIDAHFFTRGLIGRHLYALADTKEPVGVGIDESTAVIVPGNGGLWRVIGQSSVALIRRGNAANVKHLEDFTLSLLNDGDSFDPVTGRIVVSPKRKPILLLRGVDAKPIETTRIFDPNQVLTMIEALARSTSVAARGYDDASGMAVQVTKELDSTAYSDGTSITILDLGLGIARGTPSGLRLPAPVTLARSGRGGAALPQTSEEQGHAAVMPGHAAAAAMEADMAAGRRQQRDQPRIARPVEVAIAAEGNPGIVAGMDHQGRHADLRQQGQGHGAAVIVQRIGETHERCQDAVVEIEHGLHLGQDPALRCRELEALRFQLEPGDDMAVIEPVARPHDAAPRGVEVDGGGNADGAADDRAPPRLAQIFQQQIAAQGISHQQQTLARQPPVHLAQDLAQIVAAPRVVARAADALRGARAAQVEAQHGIALIQEMEGAGADIGAVLRSRQAVDQYHQRPAQILGRAMQARQQPVAIGHGEIDPLRRIGRQGGFDADDVVPQGLQVATPPRQAAAEARKA